MSHAADETRERILETAGQLFAENGFDATTVRTICEQARVNLAAVNYHFRDKRRLYVEAVKRANCSRLDRAPLPVWSADVTPARKLEEFIHTVITRMVEDIGPEWHMQLMIRELSHPTEACTEIVREFIRPQFHALQSILREVLPADVPDDKRHMIAFSIVGQCLHYRIAHPVIQHLVGPEEFSTYTPEKLAAHITRFTLAGLGMNPPEQSRVAQEVGR